MKANSGNNHLYNKELKTKAHFLRNNMTRAETTRWKYVLSGRKLQRYPFRRQRPIMNFIVDFICKDLMLVIEVDGHTHTYEKVAASDKIRQKKIEEAGYEVIRFEDDEVLNHLN